MVLHGTRASSSYLISLKPHSLAVSRDDAHVVSWDLGGRLYSVYRGDVTWRRGLGGTVLEKSGSGASRRRAWLAPAAADALVDEAAAFAGELAGAVAAREWRWSAPIEPIVRDLVTSHLRLCAGFTAEAARQDSGRFAAVYGPLGILPPDQYLALVVQATTGCSFDTCTFCDLHHDGYRVRTAGQFRAHIDDVRRYLGASINLRSRGIFLGAANALAVPMATLVRVFEILVEELDAIPKGVCTFVDGFTGSRRTVDDYRILRDLGLRRVYIGLESGHDPLLTFVRKPGSAGNAVETVRRLRSAGLQAGVIVMTGLGGERFASAHVADTIAAINQMGLGGGDLIYFSDLVEIVGTAYPHIAARESIRPLSPENRRSQRDAIRAGLRFEADGPKFATYDIREFVY